jgi:hypothetical protein
VGVDEGEPAAGMRARRRVMDPRIIAALALAAVSAAAACRGPEAAPVKAAEPRIIWRAVGSWSGRGNRQTESFTSDTGALRVKWEATRAAGAAGTPDGTLRITAHSAISGRILQPVVDRTGAGSGVDYVSQDPHVFYLSVESAGLDWKISVDEGIAAEIVGDRRR